LVLQRDADTLNMAGFDWVQEVNVMAKLILILLAGCLFLLIWFVNSFAVA
jgi:hypothetical protein